jgi:hypothetical protein
MQSRDLVYFNGSLQIHICTNREQTVCYILVHDVLNDLLTMRYFTDVESAMSWINSI